MQSLSSYVFATMSGKISFITQNMSQLNGSFLALHDSDILFANGSSPKNTNESKEIRDESGLGSGAGITPEDQARFNRQSARPDNNSLSDDDGTTGPGSDHTGDKMPGEEGVTDVTDGIARFIDDLENDDSEKGRS
ncbi:hypothetical protein GXP67_30085 [Rhodocytophaga rosea]|uniref:Uncharacterized protein n=1 Tax=Rhodocytophaga rosea TaxID=2704465 RepID=A0A6C0GT33_9BACT|nr:hypothetical protein [Rhodocytophaga rosea]QHT70602.1 hypothetical protein GXP67_30085 [Rhodocytophaga rosea]